MSDNEQETEEKPYCVELAKQGRAVCKKCKNKLPAGEIRIAKLVYNPFGGGKMKQWHHVPCLFEIFLNQRATTQRLEDVDDIDGFENLDEDNQKDLKARLDESEKKLRDKWGDKLPKKVLKAPKDIPKTPKDQEATGTSKDKPKSKDCLFREFRRLVAELTNESSYLEKTAIFKTMITKGSDNRGFKGDITQWCRLLLPGVVKRVYNLQSKQLIKLFSKIFASNQEEMLEDLEKGDIGETIQIFFDESKKLTPAKKSLLTIQEVDNFLEELSTLTKEEEQYHHIKAMTKKCTSNDLKIIVRLIKHDLRMNMGAKHVLDAVHPNAYELFQSSRDLNAVLKRILDDNDAISTSSSSKSLTATISVMTPVLPMLAEACKSVDQAMKKCPNGMYSEIKYDGERVQLHKHGNEFKYFSRSLKPVMPHKVSHFKDYIPQAFPHAKDLILDSEVLMVDTTNGKPLPFGSLGVHKREEFKNANVCLFVFDCLYFNGEPLTHKTMKERRKILKENMTEIENHIMFSEVQEVHKEYDLAKMIAKVLNLGLEGLVLKDLNGIYEPGKRHWLKVKKDYLCDGAMADTADLIVLGAWFGTGKKGGMMSVFLMGCYNEFTQRYVTVTKVHTGHDDKTLEKLQDELKMDKISCDMSKVPRWLKCTKTMVPDFVAKDPKNQPVWEITGAEFTQHDVHTADGISIRFPRVTRIRNDKTWEQATTLEELKKLFKNSKENTDYEKLLMKNKTIDEDENDAPDSKKGKNVDLGVHKIKDSKKTNKTKINIDEKCSDTDEKSIARNKKPKIEIDSDEKSGSSAKKEKFKIEDDSSSDGDKKLVITEMKVKKEPELKPSTSKKGKPNSAKKARMTDIMAEKYKKELNNFTDLFANDEELSDNKELEKIKCKRKSDDECEDPVPKKLKIKHEKDLFPLIFTNVKIFLMESLDDETDEIIRHFIAVGGDVLKIQDRDKATHFVHLQNEISENLKNDFPLNARHVVIDWIKDSIGNGKMQDTKPYAVTLIPS